MRLQIALSATMLFAASAPAGDFDNLQVFIDGDTCMLAKVSNARKAIYTGERTDIGCAIVIDRIEFKKTYSYCALSGVFPGDMCRFGDWNAAGTKVVFTASSESACTFTCVRR